MPALIKQIGPGSIAEEMDIKPGDKLLSINSHPINDILDYQYYSQDDYLVVEIEKENTEIWSLEIEKDFDEELGFQFEEPVFDRMKSCRNRCVFCFVDQLPPRMRKSLYIKDDDYRHSFLYGNFITLTNLSETDWQKIIEMRLSPLYVSVHCIQPDLRERMLGSRRAGNIKQELRRLRDAGIEVHTQIVLCPGWNDGNVLKETIEGLADLYPGVVSVGIVPVGLTGYRGSLPELNPVTKQHALKTIETVEYYQKKFRQKWDIGFVYLADEFYLRADIDVPESGYYDDYCQIENGIGIARNLLDEFAELEPSLPSSVNKREASIIMGQSAAPVFRDIVQRLNKIQGLKIEQVPVVNRFFGGGVTVTGLLTGSDIIEALGESYKGKRVIISDVLLREGQDVLLDDTFLEDIKTRSQADIRITDGSARSLIDAIFND
jgi:putative radical SAM enzyme (TIGR03279 family)